MGLIKGGDGKVVSEGLMRLTDFIKQQQAALSPLSRRQKALAAYAKQHELFATRQPEKSPAAPLDGEPHLSDESAIDSTASDTPSEFALSHEGGHSLTEAAPHNFSEDVSSDMDGGGFGGDDFGDSDPMAA